MDFIGRRYYKLNKFLLCSLGLWPTAKRIHIQPIFIYTILCSFLFAQVKLLMDEVQNHWNALDDKREIEIIEKYAYFMNIFTFAVTLSLGVGISAFSFLEFLPFILDIIVPLNESRPRNTHVPIEYFVDSERCFVFKLLHEILATFVGGMTILATGLIIMVYAQHTCGMFKIVSFRIERVLDENTLRHSSPQMERIIHNRVVHAVNLHRKTLKFFELSVSTFAILFFVLIIVGVASISINLYRLLLPSIRQNTTELLATIGLLVIHFVYMFMANYIGQVITDHSEDIFNTTCNVLWYDTPLSSQKILLFFMHRTIKSFKPTVCKMFVASLEGLATLCTTELSYLTVIYSLQ